MKRTLLALALMGCSLALNAQTYPSKPVRLIVPFPPGGGTDLVARSAGQKLSDMMGQQFLIDNRGGGGGVIGTEAVAKAPPDGYTLLLGTGSGLILNPLLGEKLPYDAFKDFLPVSLLGIAPTILVVNNTVPAKSVKELVALARSQPGKLNYASGGPGSPIHLASELLKSMTKTYIVHIPYKGTGPAMTDLLADQVQMMFTTIPGALPFMKAGKIRALAVGSARRSAAVPDVPTVSEAGVTGFEAVSWYGLFAPDKTPRDIINRLSEQTRKALSDQEVVQRLASQGAEAQASTPEELAKFMTEEHRRWEKVIKEANIKLE
jgi:tripartite-type tricarboxylate transporter receptor subunit TctC